MHRFQHHIMWFNFNLHRRTLMTFTTTLLLTTGNKPSPSPPPSLDPSKVTWAKFGVAFFSVCWDKIISSTVSFRFLGEALMLFRWPKPCVCPSGGLKPANRSGKWVVPPSFLCMVRFEILWTLWVLNNNNVLTCTYNVQTKFYMPKNLRRTLFESNWLGNLKLGSWRTVRPVGRRNHAVLKKSVSPTLEITWDY